MAISNKKETLFLLIGDFFCFAAALWLTLVLRYGEMPSLDIWYDHLRPFSILFILWAIAFFIIGLYDRHTLLLKSKLSVRLLNAQVVNALIAVVFFYFIPTFGINPKVNLFIYLVISVPVIFLWRLYVRRLLPKGKRHSALLVGSGPEMQELYEEINGNSDYNLKFVSIIDLKKFEKSAIHSEVINRVFAEGISIIVADFRNEKIVPVLPHLYNLIFSQISFIEMQQIYEDTFNRVPLSLLQHSWFLENMSRSSSALYRFLKRSMDIFVAFVVAIISLIAYPLVALAIKLDDGGPVFIKQERVGKDRKSIHIYKFRTMQRSENGVWIGETQNEVTRVGRFLRALRIDELPQLWSVVIGDMSLIGPRPDLSGLEARLRNEIPYYAARYLVEPGLSGWAQTRQVYVGGNISPQSVEETRVRLSYDLYYVKNRSLLLDIGIALRTVKILFSRSGS